MPALPELLGHLVVAQFHSKRVVSIHLVDHSDVDHAHGHDPEVEDVLLQDVLGLSFVFGGIDCFEDVLEGKHPGAIHEVGDVHGLELEVVDVVDPVAVVPRSCVDLLLGSREVPILDPVHFIDDRKHLVSVVVQVDGLPDLVGDHEVHQNGAGHDSNGKGAVAGLATLAPGLKLKAMRAEDRRLLVEVGESESLLQIVSAVVKVEEQLVAGTSAEDGATDIVVALPDVSDYLLGVGILEQLDDLVVIDHVETVPIVEIRLHEKELHFFFVVHAVQVLLGNVDDAGPDLSNPPVEVGELLANPFDELNQEARGLDDVQSKDEDVASRLGGDALFNGRQELDGLFIVHVLDEPLQQEGLAFKHPVRLGERANKEVHYLLNFLVDLQEVLSVH